MEFIRLLVLLAVAVLVAYVLSIAVGMIQGVFSYSVFNIDLSIVRSVCVLIFSSFFIAFAVYVVFKYVYNMIVGEEE